MPPVWRGRRRALLLCLAGLGVLQAVLALCLALGVDGLLSGAGASAAGASGPLGAGALGILASALGIGAARWLERVVAERLGQDYVAEQRRLLVAASLDGVGNPSLGVVVTRASNDLTAVRNWIAQGVVPLVTALPLIGIVLGALALTNPLLAAAVALPLLGMAAALPGLSRSVHRRARELRRLRGRMSAHIADTVRAGESVRASGAVRRELNAVDRHSGRVVDAAVRRAWATGLVRAITVTAASLGTVAVVVLAAGGGIGVAQAASAMTLLGVLAAPLADLGRVVEYRQNYRAARRILAPLLAEARQRIREERRRERRWRDAPMPEAGPAELSAVGIRASGVELPALVARPGERILLRSAHPEHERAAIRALLAGEAAATGAGEEPDGEAAAPRVDGTGASGRLGSGAAATPRLHDADASGIPDGEADAAPRIGDSGTNGITGSGTDEAGSAPWIDDADASRIPRDGTGKRIHGTETFRSPHPFGGPTVEPDPRPRGVRLGGVDLAEVPARRRRALVGFASQLLPLERGSVRRLAAYRNPDALTGQVRWLLQRVGLGVLSDRELRTTLKNDGAPWSGVDVAKLKLARALLGTPPLLVLEHLDSGLDAPGLDRLRELLAGYPGVVVLASRHPDRVLADYREWDLDGDGLEPVAVTGRGRIAGEDAEDE
ncbi:hypothetical protein FM112_09885 [Gulosibacter sp. 10]|nr:hypothetical protein FM112_09885 [Gulosibacter sp. 10]